MRVLACSCWWGSHDDEEPYLLDDAVRAALAAGVKAREILEIILQCAVYGGQTR